MAFNPPGGGGGSSSIAGSTDVALNSPQDDQVLTYDSSSSKWQNQSSASLNYVILEADETVVDLPADTPEGTLVFRYDA